MSMKSKRNKRNLILLSRILTILAIVLTVVLVIALVRDNLSKKAQEALIIQQQEEEEARALAKAQEEAAAKREATIKEADTLALMYDYDSAISLISSIEDYENDSRLTNLVASYEASKAACVPVDIFTTTHIFYHSLVVDTNLAFSDPDHRPAAVGHNQWMTTIDEFNKITQEMYDRGYVLVSIHDLVDTVTDESGNTTFVPKELLLPPDKKPFILSLDDLSYYHAYDGYGYATKLVLNDDGKPVCEYTDVEGNTTYGLYDAVPLLDAFVEAHPDASYHGAKGTVALTGYNGILGYRTDETYDYNSPSIDRHQRKWMDEHPDFNLENERAQAKLVADAMKAEGWEFASHTWGHLRAGEVSMERLTTDTQRWLNNVAPLVGGTDMLIFAHGADISGNGEYSASNERFNYLKSQGFNMFFNVDSHVHTLGIYPNYVHQGRRNIDGYRIYYNTIGNQDNLSDLFDPATVIDPSRPPVRPL